MSNKLSHRQRAINAGLSADASPATVHHVEQRGSNDLPQRAINAGLPSDSSLEAIRLAERGEW